MKSRALCLVDKSLAAMLAAMEVYNKPDFSYREETFAVLAINAWELLLKARVLQLANNRLSAILDYERRQRADGTMSAMRYRKRNRSGTHMSISLFKAFDVLVNEFGENPDPKIRQNLELLVEIRDNAIHFLNKGFEFERRVQELGSACLKNYLTGVRQWFGKDLSQYNFFLMPLSFFRHVGRVEGISLNADEKLLLKYLERCFIDSDDEPTADYNLALRLDIRLSRATGTTGTQVVISSSPNAIPVTIEEEDIRQRYPWTYKNLVQRLRRRYSDFSQNNKFYGLKKEFEEEEKFCKVRLLDPGNPNSGNKKFYNPNIVTKFDEHYTKTT